MRTWLLLVAALALGAGLVIQSTVLSARMDQEDRDVMASDGPHGPTDPELAKGLEAFADSRYADARRVAETLLAKRNRGSTHAEAIDLLAEAWLAEGDFARARAATEKYRDEDRRTADAARKRVEEAERTYQRELVRLETRERTSRTPEAAAEAHLRLGHLQKTSGHRREAAAIYTQTIARYPHTRAAARARRQLESLPATERSPSGEHVASAAGQARP